MDKKQLIGFLLMGALLVVFFFTSQNEEADKDQNTNQEKNIIAEPTEPSKEVLKETAVIENNISQTAELDSAGKAILDKEVLSKYGQFASSFYGEESKLILQNSLLKTELSSKGGMFEKATLTDGYTKYNSDEPIQLWIPDESEMNFSFEHQGIGTLNTRDFHFETIQSNSTATENNPASLQLRLKTDDPSKYIDFNYSLAENSYEIKFDLQVVGMNQIISSNDSEFTLNWDAVGYGNEKSIEYERQSSSVFYREMDESRDYLRETQDKNETLEEKLNWFSFKQKFFSALVINENGFSEGSYIASKPPENAKDSLRNMLYSAKALVNIENSSNSVSQLRFFFGPNDYKVLDALEVEEITRIIDYGPWIIGWVNRNIVRPLYFFLSGFIGNAGIIILIITLIIKTLLFPITWKNYLSSAKMRVLKPEINEINEKYKGKEKAVEKQQETMKLYRQTGVNPFAGCIPVILQMPILYAMFRFFPASIELRGKSFLWADDLSAYDALINLPTELPIYGAHISGFTVMMAISTFIYTRMNSSNMAQPQQPGMPNMKVIMNIFPVIMLVFFNKFASSLSLYYFIANMVSISQMWIIKKYIIDEDKIRAKIDTNKAKPRKKSSFQSRLEEMQKQQQQKLKQQKKSK